MMVSVLSAREESGNSGAAGIDLSAQFYDVFTLKEDEKGSTWRLKKTAKPVFRFSETSGKIKDRRNVGPRRPNPTVEEFLANPDKSRS